MKRKKLRVIKKEHLVLGIIFLAAFGLRVWGANFGLPNFFFHVDETAIFSKGVNFFSPSHRENKPVAIFNLYVFILYHLYSFIRNLFFGKAYGSLAKAEFLLWARIMSGVASSLSVVLVYLIAKKIFDRKVALWTALFLSLTFVDIQIAHYLRPDTYIQFLGLLLLFLVFGAKRSESFLVWMLVGVLGALRASGFIFLVPLVFSFWNSKERFTPRRLRVFLFLFSGVFLGFVLSHPTAFKEGVLNYFFHYYELWTRRGASMVGADSSNGMSSFSWWFDYLFTTGLHHSFFITFVLGIIVLIRDCPRFSFPRKKAVFGLGLMLFFYFLAFFLRPVRFDRYVVPVTPLIAIASGYFLVRVLDRIKSVVADRVFPIFKIGIVSLIFIPSILRGIAFDYLISQRDTREKAALWIEEKLPKDQVVFAIGDTIHIGHYLQKRGFDNVMNLFPLDTDEIFYYSGEYLLIDSATYHLARNYRNNKKYKNFWKNYQLIKDRGILIREFSEPLFKSEFFSSSWLEHSSTVNAYHHPTVEIYKVPQIPDFVKKRVYFEYLPEEMRTNMELVEKEGQRILYADGKRKVRISGPHELFPKGEYLLSYLLLDGRCRAGLKKVKLVLWVTSSGGARRYAEKKFDCGMLKGYNKLYLPFRLKKAGRLEFVLEADQGISFFVKKAVLKTASLQ